MKHAAALLGLVLIATPANASPDLLGTPYSVIREKMLRVGYIPVYHTGPSSGCSRTRLLGDYRCELWPELELCNLEAPSLCVADWLRPRGGAVKVVIHGFRDPVYYTSGEPQ